MEVVILRSRLHLFQCLLPHQLLSSIGNFSTVQCCQSNVCIQIDRSRQHLDRPVSEQEHRAAFVVTTEVIHVKMIVARGMVSNSQHTGESILTTRYYAGPGRVTPLGRSFANNNRVTCTIHEAIKTYMTIMEESTVTSTNLP